MTVSPECQNKTLVECEACQLWCKFLPKIERTAEEHEQTYRSDCPVGKYRSPPPIPKSPCLEVEPSLIIAREKRII